MKTGYLKKILHKAKYFVEVYIHIIYVYDYENEKIEIFI